jgi:hypothetical protein
MSTENRSGEELDKIFLTLATIPEKRAFVAGMNPVEIKQWLDAVWKREGQAFGGRRNKKRSTRRKKRRGKRSRNYKTKRV